MSTPPSVSRFPLADGNGSARAVSVCTDPSGLERYAYQLFCRAAEETTDAPQRSRNPRLQAALNPARVKKATQTTTAPVPLPYQLWIAHLLWLEEVLHTLDWGPQSLTAVELAGLQALSRAREHFARSHRFCPHCEAVNPRSAGTTRCRRCHQEY